ncbi:hypothetical protein C8Q73DRAFT_686430 [Cubamyces lactineus]|nr:hypothetical protein C8Q73DRAFT_686430 [Cubamyces lactineus]
MACIIAIPSVFVHVPDRRHDVCPFPFGNLYSPTACRSHSLAEHADRAHNALPTLQGPGALTLSAMLALTQSSHALKMYVKDRRPRPAVPACLGTCATYDSARLLRTSPSGTCDASPGPSPNSPNDQASAYNSTMAISAPALNPGAITSSSFFIMAGASGLGVILYGPSTVPWMATLHRPSGTCFSTLRPSTTALGTSIATFVRFPAPSLPITYPLSTTISIRPNMARRVQAERGISRYRLLPQVPACRRPSLRDCLQDGRCGGEHTAALGT